MPVEPDAALVERLRAELPEAPGARIRRLEADLGFQLAEDLVTSGRDELYGRVAGDRTAVANVIMNQLAGTGVDPTAVDAAELGRLVEARDRIPRASFAEAIAKVGEPGFSADAYLAQEVVSDSSELEPVVARVLDANPGQVAAYRGGKEGLLGFFVGQVLKELGGNADPRVVSDLVRKRLLSGGSA